MAHDCFREHQRIGEHARGQLIERDVGGIDVMSIFSLIF
jgi:hypothetical protein